MRRALLLLLIAITAAAAWAAETAPMVPERVIVVGDEVTLGDLVRAAGLPAADRLFLVRLVKSPNPGQQRSLNRHYVLRQLTAEGLGHIGVPARITVERPGRAIDPALGRELVLAYIREHAPWPPERYRIEMTRAHDPITVEPGEVTARLIQRPADRLEGTHTYVVEYRVGGRRVARGGFTMKVHVQATAFVAATQLNRGILLAERDLIAREMDLADLRGLPETDKAKLIGARLRHTIREGQIVTSDALEPVPLVRRGDAVTIVARRGDMVVTAFGLAREDGALGEVVRVENLQSQRVVHARVRGNNTVAVLF